MNAAGYSMPGLNRADFKAWPVAKCYLIFSNLGKVDFWSRLPVADAKEANIDRTRAKCAQRWTVPYWF
jgi:hypothetical protein